MLNTGLLDSDEFITIATTRPETSGDTAVCVNPAIKDILNLKAKVCGAPCDRIVP
jgi:valyl-tRNA synthetase